MRVIAQRSNYAEVSVDNKLINMIDFGLVLLVAFTQNDTINDIDYMINKIIKLRIFADENNVMNKNVIEVGGKILSISQFTLYADTNKGNRPSYVKALNSDEASKLYDTFNDKLGQYIETKTGIFGADMNILINNNGPVTIMLDSKKENND